MFLRRISVCKLGAQFSSLNKPLYPFVENVRSTWPEMKPSPEVLKLIPKRTVPDSELRFTLRAQFEHGMAIFYPHLKFNPADFKVILDVSFSRVCIIMSLHLFSCIGVACR